MPQTIFLDVPTLGIDKNHRLAVYDWGNSQSAETVFCIHGLTRNGRDFDILAEELSKTHRVLCLDIAGRGKSQWHEDYKHYNYGDYVADATNVISQLGLSRINFVGTSMGGIIGMMLANSAPKLLKTLTLNDVGCFIPASGLKRISQYVAVNVFKTRVEAESALRLRCAAYGITSEAHWQNMFANGIDQTEDGSFRLAYDAAIAKNFGNTDEIKDVDLWQLWEALKPIPTLLIRGEKSDILPRETALQMKTSHPNLTLLEIPSVGHAPALTDEFQISAIKNRIYS